MAMFRKAVFPGKYIQGKGACHELSALIGTFGGKGMIAASPSAFDTVLSQVKLPEDCLVEKFEGECCEQELSRLTALAVKHGVRSVTAIGGGKVIDTGKIVADRLNIPMIVVPTIASTDAPCSGCAVVYTDKGVFDTVYYQKRNPDAVLVDSGVIVQAPVRFLVAGMGDALSTWFEARSCAGTASANVCGGISTISGLALAKLCYDTLLEYGHTAKVMCEQKIISPAVERIIEANILLSGIGFESSGLAAAHAIHNGLTALAATHHYYHGEKVAFGVLAGLHLTDAPEAEMDTVYGFCEKVGLPTTLAALGLVQVTPEELRLAADAACAPSQSIHHEAGEMTPEKVLNAILAADAMGRNRMAR